MRLDLKIPPENHMYLRAATSAERQQWLVALGTAKACRVDTSYQEQRQQSEFGSPDFDAWQFIKVFEINKKSRLK